MIKVVIADDHDIVRDGVRRIIEMRPSIEVVGEAGNAGGALKLCNEYKPDVILLDYDMPDMDGLESVKQISASCPKTKILVLTMHDNVEYAVRALQAGASGFMLKASSPGDLPAAIEKIAGGGRWLSPSIMEQIALRHTLSTDNDPVASLSDRELQILKCISAGLGVSDISNKLNLSKSTVATYKKRLKEKLNLSKDVEIARFAEKHGLSAE